MKLAQAFILALFVLTAPMAHAAPQALRVEIDAGDSIFGPETNRSLAALRLRLGTWLSAKAPAPRERWYDPRPTPRDPATVPAIAPLPVPE